MRIKVRSVQDAGNLEKERVVIYALEDGQIGSQILASTQRHGAGVSNEIYNAYWIPDREIKKDDVVVVYTKSGKNTDRKNKDETRSYFFYMGLDKPTYVNDKVAAVVFSIDKWKVAPLSVTPDSNTVDS
ncbi:hypothetical protein BVH03_25040 [Pseudomonas sp. PA15(2017)]|uniref:hypothetical protein n=1 Tax=Pseudomonas sp. PA15(2017) TaxID=1932111 RepID=UPI00095D8A35|nr:hypothetical protein [Pseudomonas sp. PA15(2017)]OLU22492.1 hypothetical protein BVH03_25040 [Pseudomonas sp. PA15(2017)]